jgi:hypothetical protein
MVSANEKLLKGIKDTLQVKEGSLSIDLYQPDNSVSTIRLFKHYSTEF